MLARVAWRGSGSHRVRLSCLALVESHDHHASPHALVLARRADTDALGETIAALAARLHAATYELVVLLREFDQRTGWTNGFLSCARWLPWRTGIDHEEGGGSRGHRPAVSEELVGASHG
jgi:hypothetical protein